MRQSLQYKNVNNWKQERPLNIGIQIEIECELNIYKSNKFMDKAVKNTNNQLHRMNTKLQSPQEAPTPKGLSKKLKCSQHTQKYLFKCDHPNCQFPFICGNVECIENHLHQEKIVMRKFSSEVIANKFMEVDCLVTDDSIYQNAKILKNSIDGLKETIKNVFIGIKNLNQNYDYLKGQIQGPLSVQYISRVQETFSLNQNVRKSVEQLKQKIKIDFPVKDSYFTLRSYLLEFLNQNIKGFNWTKSKELFSSKSDSITCQKFHQKLAGIPHLLFIFVGQSRIVGSYYSCEYPLLSERSKKDNKSFLFISQKQFDSQRFLKFQACQQADHHISISEKNYICQGNTPSYGDGIRTFHKNFENIQYCLPSNTYKLKNTRRIVNTVEGQQIFNGTLKVRRFMILQGYKQNQLIDNDSINQLQVQIQVQQSPNSSQNNNSSSNSNPLLSKLKPVFNAGTGQKIDFQEIHEHKDEVGGANGGVSAPSS